MPRQARGPWPKAWKACLGAGNLALPGNSRAAGRLLLLAEVVGVEVLRVGVVPGPGAQAGPSSGRHLLGVPVEALRAEHQAVVLL